MKSRVGRREFVPSNASHRADEKFDYQAFIVASPGAGSIAEYFESDVIYAQGDPADSLFYLITGSVKASAVSEQGKEAIIAMLGPGSFFGEGCLEGAPTRVTTVTATSVCKVARLCSEAVTRALSNNPQFSRVFLKYLVGRSERLKKKVIHQLFDSSEKRLARILMTLAGAGTGANPRLIAIPISQDLLAKMVGTTRPRISQFMNKFRKLGYIDYDGRIRVHNSLVNVILDDETSATRQ